MRRSQPTTRCCSIQSERPARDLKSRKPLVLFLVCLVPFLLLGAPGEGKIVDRIVAIVNEDIITLSELEAFRKTFFPSQSKRKDWLSLEFALSDVRYRALDTLIEEKLIDQEAERQQIQVTERELREALDSLREERGLSQSQLEAALRAQGLTYDEYKERVEKGLKRTRLINRVIKSKIEMDEEEIKAYYQAHRDDYMVEQSIRISHILLPIAPGSSENEEGAALSMAEEILTRADKGEDFDTLAYEYSQRVADLRWGDLGYFKKGEMIPAIEKVAFGLEVGQVGGPIQTAEGVVLVKVTDKKGGSPLPFEKARKRVENDYYRKELKRRYREWVKKLKERSFIEVKL